MALSSLDVAYVVLSDLGWVCEWGLVAIAWLKRHKRHEDCRRWTYASLGVLLGSVLVLVVMKVASFDLDDPTSLRPASHKTTCGVFDFGAAPSSQPMAGYPSGHAYLTTLATVLLVSFAHFEGTPWSWVTASSVLTSLTLVARRGLMCHTMLQLVDGVFLGILVGACVIAIAYAPRDPQPSVEMTTVTEDSSLHQPISGPP